MSDAPPGYDMDQKVPPSPQQYVPQQQQQQTQYTENPQVPPSAPQQQQQQPQYAPPPQQQQQYAPQQPPQYAQQPQYAPQQQQMMMDPQQQPQYAQQQMMMAPQQQQQMVMMQPQAQQPMVVMGAPPPVVIVMPAAPPPVTIQTTNYKDHNGPCSTFMNILWIIFGGGIVMFFMWGIFGVLAGITIIGIPVAKQFFKLAILSLLPFGRVVNYGENKCPDLCGNLIWLPFGFMLAMFHVLFGLMMIFTLIGIPFGLQHFKLAKLALWPCGAKIETQSVASQTTTTISHV